jgi:CelD/BcsL family acetyltransferase involved in cellulose biosynthesis
MRTRIVGLSDLTDHDLRDWRELAGRAIEPNPYFEPDFVLPAARSLARPAEVGVLVAEGADGWAACLPVRRAWRWRRLPLRSLTVWRHLYCYLGTPLVSDDRPRSALERLLEQATRDRTTTAFVLDWLGAGGPVGSILGEVLAERRGPALAYEAFDRGLLRRRAEDNYLDDGLSVKRRKEFRRLERRLADDLGVPLGVIDRGSDGSAPAEFSRLEAAGWKGRAGTALASSTRHNRFFVEVCAAFGKAGRLQMLALEGGERTVAMQCNLLAGEGLFCFKVAYDEDLAAYSPGAQLELGAVSEFHRRDDVEWMDSCAAPDNELINRLWPDRRRIASVVVARGGRLGRSALAGVRSAAALRERAERAPLPRMHDAL